MLYSLLRLMYFIVTVALVLAGNYLHENFPGTGMNIVLVLFGFIFAALIAWGLRNVAESQAEERAEELLRERENDKQDDGKS